jgi:hypothetical protein
MKYKYIDVCMHIWGDFGLKNPLILGGMGLLSNHNILRQVWNGKGNFGYVGNTNCITLAIGFMI